MITQDLPAFKNIVSEQISKILNKFSIHHQPQLFNLYNYLQDFEDQDLNLSGQEIAYGFYVFRNINIENYKRQFAQLKVEDLMKNYKKKITGKEVEIQDREMI